MNETLSIADLEFEVRRSARRKTLGLTVDRAGDLVVHAPHSATEEELRRWVGRKLVWVHQKLALKKELTGAIQHPDFVSGESIFYLGRNYRLKLVGDQDEPLRFDGQWFHLRRADRPDATQHFRRWYVGTGIPWLRKRVAAWQPRVDAAPTRVSVGDLGFRWGSCGKNGVLHFNWRLLQLPVRLVDYVIVHELVHLQERNHTARFRRIMDRVLPDWRQRKSELESGWQSYVAFGIETGRSGTLPHPDAEE
jgi:hypothetical protein